MCIPVCVGRSYHLWRHILDCKLVARPASTSTRLRQRGLGVPKVEATSSSQSPCLQGRRTQNTRMERWHGRSIPVPCCFGQMRKDIVNVCLRVVCSDCTLESTARTSSFDPRNTRCEVRGARCEVRGARREALGAVACDASQAKTTRKSV